MKSNTIYSALYEMTSNKSTDNSLFTQYTTNTVEGYNAINAILDSVSNLAITHKVKNENVSITIETLLKYAKNNEISFVVLLNTKERDTALNYKWSFASEVLNKDKKAVTLQLYPNDLRTQKDLSHALVSASIQYIDYLFSLWIFDNYQVIFKDNASGGRRLNKKFVQSAYCLGFKCTEKENTILLSNKQVKELTDLTGKLYEMVQLSYTESTTPKEKKVFAYVCPVCGHIHLKGVNQKKDRIACVACAEKNIATIINGATEVVTEETNEKEGE